MFQHSQMSVLTLTSECWYMLKFTSELTLRCEDWYIQKGRNHHVTTLIALKSSQMSIIFMIVHVLSLGNHTANPAKMMLLEYWLIDIDSIWYFKLRSLQPEVIGIYVAMKAWFVQPNVHPVLL